MVRIRFRPPASQLRTCSNPFPAIPRRTPRTRPAHSSRKDYNRDRTTYLIHSPFAPTMTIALSRQRTPS